MKKLQIVFLFLGVAIIIVLAIMSLRGSAKQTLSGGEIAASSVTPRNETKTITINNKPLTIEIVSDGPAVTEGLGDRDSLPLDHGMLFLFSIPDRYAFWMRHMHFPLDILWIQNGIIVDLATLPPPKSWEIPATYKPRSAADHVLELNAGQAQAYGLKVGSAISF